ncbi:MAG: DUF1223 domain-containing protein [Alphaproteobacteria bacterium]|nr:DUF1223 domain-containing protein [Alphaproteobacteria bacterium]
MIRIKHIPAMMLVLAGCVLLPLCVKAEPILSTPLSVKPPVSAPPVVIELFSSQACTYCPPADEYMADLLKQDGVIGLSCHVDYFDVRQGSLAHKFCSRRQSDYAKTMGLKSVYTPQMVINGHIDAIGYESAQVSIGVLKARAEKISEISIRPLQNGQYAYALPAQAVQDPDVTLWVALFDKPHTLTVAEGGNRGKNLTYHNIVSSLIALETEQLTSAEKTFLPYMKANAAGFALLAQNNQSGKIIAAGQVILP